MPGWDSIRKDRDAKLYPKSTGEYSLNENQVIQPFEWERNADRSIVTVKNKSGYVFDFDSLTVNNIPVNGGITNESYRPPIGVPTFWFTSLPDWALDCTDGGEYLWADYPELDNDIFKGFLNSFTTDFGASIDTNADGLSFNMPDLRGINSIIAGTNDLIAIKDVEGEDTENYYDGGDVGELIRDAIREIIGTAGYFVGRYEMIGWGAFRTYPAGHNVHANGTDYLTRYINFAASRVVPVANNNRVASFGCSLIVRFE